MADTPDTPDQPAKAPPKPRPRRSGAKGGKATKPARAQRLVSATDETVIAAEPVVIGKANKMKVPPKPRSSKRATPRVIPKPPKQKSQTPPVQTPPVVVETVAEKPAGKWGTAAIAGGLALAGAAAAALLSLRSSTPKPLPATPGKAHQADGTDSSASFEAGIADEGTIPEAPTSKE